MTLTCRVYRSGRLEEQHADTRRIDEYLSEPDVMVWLDVEGPTPEAMTTLAGEFGFHELAVEDSLQPHQRPKIEQYPHYFFLVAYGATLPNGRNVILHEVDVFVAHNYLVTVRKDPVLEITSVAERWEAHPELAKEGGGYLLYLLLDEIVDGYFGVLDALEDRTDEMEELVFGPGSSDTDTQQAIFALKKEMLKFRRTVVPLRDVLDVMQRRIVDVVSAPLEPYYRDVYDHVLRAADFIDGLRDILSSALDAQLSVVSNRLNVIIKHLTSYAAIILVPTLIAGIYGMNFRHLPELTWRYGYAYALAVMAGSSVVLYWFFKRRDWL
jgi:magnesium transporter